MPRRAAPPAPSALPAVAFRVERVCATEFAAVPTLSFTLRAESAGGVPIRSIALESQIRIAATRRAYDAAAQERLSELFGAPSRWGTTLRSLLWTHASVQVPPFTGSTLVELPVACTYDFDVAVVKYFAALDEGEIPLEFLFSGTVFYAGEGGLLRTVRLSWETEAEFRFPVSVWTEMMAHYFPNSAWLRLRTDTLDRLYAYRAKRALPTWDDAVAALLGDGEREAEGERVDAVEQIARAVLYEGYILWPYRRSAIKNQQRWTFGGVFPEAYSTASGGNDPCVMQTQCLLIGDDDARIDVHVRFLHVVERQVTKRAAGVLVPVDQLDVGNTRYLSWDEATEREVVARCVGLRQLMQLSADGRSLQRPIAIAAGVEEETLRDADGANVGALVRRWQSLEGVLELRADGVGERLTMVTARIANSTAWHGDNRQAALARTFVSTHTVLRATSGTFVSLTDPPDALRAAADDCRNIGTWPVLVGEPRERDTLLSSPIILPDYPQIAPESPGDLFDGGEIDQLLILNILSMTDDEKQEMRGTDPRAREILDRCDSLTPKELMRLHGTVRELRPLRP